MLWQGEALNYSKRGLLALRQQVATVFQDPDQQIFYTDIDSDIAFSLRNLGVAEEEIARRVDEALTLVDARGFRQQPIQCLSHGQKKRVAIAGALVLQARYLLLDEPTAGLDPRGRAQMIAIIRRIVGQGRRVVISSHDIDLIYEVSDAVYVLRHGEVLAAGDPGEVFACAETMDRAGLTQPWLVKLHSELGLPLCKNRGGVFSADAQQRDRRDKGGVMTLAVMLQGTASDVGKSVLVAGLCRIFHQDGLRTAPFKSQNMALNSGITPDGKRWAGRRFSEAEAAGIAPDVRMNPILLKPTSDRQAQVVLMGQVATSMDAVSYHQYKPRLREQILAVYQSPGRRV